MPPKYRPIILSKRNRLFCNRAGNEKQLKGYKSEMTMVIRLMWCGVRKFTFGDIPKNNYAKSTFSEKIIKLKKLHKFFSKFHRWFKNVLQHLRKLFRTHHLWEKSLEMKFKTFEKKVFFDF